ncbi:MAG: hypothetical protein ACK5ND_05950 [Bacteroides sp.]
MIRKKGLLALLLLLPLFINSCTQEETQLTDTEMRLVGSWISNDDPHEVFYLNLKADGTGDISNTYDGTEEEFSSFNWSASPTVLRLDHKSGRTETLNYQYSGGNTLTVGSVSYQKR